MPFTPVSGFQLIFEFNEGDYGWKEDFFVSGSTTYPDIESDVLAMATLRKTVLSSNAAIYGCSVRPFLINGLGTEFLKNEVVAAKGKGGPVTAPIAGPGTAVDLGPAEPIWDGLEMTLQDVARQYRRPYTMRGLPSNFLAWAPNTGGGLTGVGKGAIQPWLSLLNNTLAVGNGGLPSGELAMRTRVHDPALVYPGPLTGLQPIVGAALNPAVCGTDIWTGLTSPPWTMGQTVHIHNIGGCSSKGLNGDHPVLSVAIATGAALAAGATYVTTIAAQPCCCSSAPLVIGKKGTIYWVRYTLTDLAIATPGAVSRRATGGPNGGSRGRSSGCRR